MTTTFPELGVPADLVHRLSELGMTEPFPIQSLTLKDALAGRDLCGRAPTGSGKTLAFALPIAMRSRRAQPGRPRALVLVPTRELAAQVRDVLEPLLRVTGGSVATFYGGTNINRDLQRLRQRLDVAVATPGRLEDLIQRRAIRLDAIDLVVLDEADRMADMGFLPAMKRILDRTPRERQTLLFSATLDGDVDVLVRRYQRSPVRHVFDAPEESSGDVHHVFWPAERSDRRRLTAQIVRQTRPAIVFTRTKHGADRLAKQLRQDGITTAAIHGNRNQNQRERALRSFAAGEVHALIATDVAARGIHIDDVAVVVHYDQPASDKDYVHRSGRTGRAGATGVVVSLVGSEEASEVRSLQRSLALPQGLHDLDLGLLNADVLPAPNHHATSRGAAQRQRSAEARPAGGNRNRTRAKQGGRGAQRSGGARSRARRR